MLDQQLANNVLDRTGGQPEGRWITFPDSLRVSDLVAQPLSVPGGVDRTHGAPVAINDEPL